MSDRIYDELKAAAKNDDVPQDLVNRLMLSGMADIMQKIGSINARIDNVDTRLKTMERYTFDNPSLVWLLKNRPIKTSSIIVATIIAVTILATYAPNLFVLFGVNVP